MAKRQEGETRRRIGASALIALVATGGFLAWGLRALWKIPPSRMFPPPRLSPVEAQGSILPPVSSSRVLFVGHSLVNTEMPAMLASIAESLGIEHSSDAQLRSGASLKKSWEEPELAEGVHARNALASGAYDTFVMTEAVDLDDMLRWMKPYDYATRFYRLAIEHRPTIRIFLYETWHDRSLVRRNVFGLPRAAGWREFLDEDLGKWESIVEEVRQRAGGERMNVVPGGQAFARLTDEIRGGRVPGLVSEAELFSDDIHLTPLGNYFIALVQFATIHRRSPEGATTAPRDARGEVVRFSDATARVLQRIAWEAVVGYPWSGVRGTENVSTAR